MLASWKPQTSVSSTRVDLQSLSLNVLCYAAFGVKSDFAAKRNAALAEESIEPTELGYPEALHYILKSLLNLMVLPMIEKLGVPPSWLGSSLKKMWAIREQFKARMVQMIAHERTQYEAGDTDRHNLISTLIRADIAAKKETSSTSTSADHTDQKPDPLSVRSKGLTEAEIFGNLFVYSLAGHDTTASTLAFAIIRLALHPHMQDWLATEIDTALQSLSRTPSAPVPSLSTIQSSYTTLFPLLPRCLAVMHETLRHHGPVPNNPRTTLPTAPSTRLLVKDGGPPHFLPAGTMVVANFAAVHANPNTWGEDVDDFKPERFIVTVEDEENGGSREKCKDFNGPGTRGFVAWNRGPRTCPGRKFSQVEFVAVLCVLLARGGRVEFVGAEGEEGGGGGRERAEAEAEARRVMREAELELALRMQEDVPVRWVVKGEEKRE